jgi:hypothetical protein
MGRLPQWSCCTQSLGPAHPASVVNPVIRAAVLARGHVVKPQPVTHLLTSASPAARGRTTRHTGQHATLDPDAVLLELSATCQGRVAAPRMTSAVPRTVGAVNVERRPAVSVFAGFTARAFALPTLVPMRRSRTIAGHRPAPSAPWSHDRRLGGRQHEAIRKLILHLTRSVRNTSLPGHSDGRLLQRAGIVCHCTAARAARTIENRIRSCSSRTCDPNRSSTSAW